MSYNGSGTFQINSAGQPVVTGTVISSTAFNALTTDLATGLSTAITKDGQTTPTANIKLGGFKLTNVGAATTSGDALTFGSGTNSSSLAVPTWQNLTSGTAATYTTPANCRQLRIRMVGGGGGGGGTFGGSDATAGGDTSFNSIVAKGGARGNGDSTIGALGGTGGAGSASYRAPGGAGSPPSLTSTSVCGGNGGNSAFGAGALGGGGAGNGAAAGANTGAGGGAGGNTSQTAAGAGGGAGEYVEIIVNSPAATYTYTVGAGGTGGSGGTNGGAGGSGVIIVDEIY